MSMSISYVVMKRHLIPREPMTFSINPFPRHHHHHHQNQQVDLATSPIRFLVILPAFIILWISLNDNETRSKMGVSLLSENNGVAINGSCENVHVHYRILEDGNIGGNPFTRFGVFCGDQNLSPSLTVAQWTQSMLQDNPDSRKRLTDALCASRYPAFFLETKGVTRESSHQLTFEFVLVDAPQLYSFAESNASPHAFSEHLTKCDSACCSFPNLGRDALLIAPQLQQDQDPVSYSHLAAFVRRAPPSQVDDLWKLVATEYSKTTDNKVWLSTDGTGVPWLHVRLDSRPKYYTYKPFAI